ncbi:MAG: hypothetical protein V5A57_01195 [Candidatus Paceibacterota bacterium]
MIKHEEPKDNFGVARRFFKFNQEVFLELISIKACYYLYFFFYKKKKLYKK